MPGKLEPFRKLLSRKPLQFLRDALVVLAWRLDPDLSALRWTVLDCALTEARKSEFLSSTRYDRHFRQLRAHLRQDPEWRLGPEKSWSVGLGPLGALKYLSAVNSSCVLDFGCGTLFSDSTAIILYLCGVQAIDCLDIAKPYSGFSSGAAVDLVHWIEDKEIGGALPPLPDGVCLNDVRLKQVHEFAVLRQCDAGDTLPAIRLLQGDIRGREADTYDLITSNAVLEHVDSPAAVWDSLKHVLRPGGVMHHIIDFRDHRSYYHPDQFVPLPPRKVQQHWGDLSTNGWRYADWIGLVEQDPELTLLESIRRSTNNQSFDPGQACGDEIASCELVVKRL